MGGQTTPTTYIWPTNIFDIPGAPAIVFSYSFLGQSRKLVPFLSFFPTSNEILQDKSNEKKD